MILTVLIKCLYFPLPGCSKCACWLKLDKKKSRNPWMTILKDKFDIIQYFTLFLNCQLDISYLNLPVHQWTSLVQHYRSEQWPIPTVLIHIWKICTKVSTQKQIMALILKITDDALKKKPVKNIYILYPWDRLKRNYLYNQSQIVLVWQCSLLTTEELFCFF